MVASENSRKSFCSSFDHSFSTTWLPRDWLTNCLTEGHGSWWTVSSFPQGSHCSSHRRCMRTLIPIRGGPDLWGPARLFRNTGGQDCRVTQWTAKSLELDRPEFESWLVAMWPWSSHSTFSRLCFQKYTIEMVKSLLLGSGAVTGKIKQTLNVCLLLL